MKASGKSSAPENGRVAELQAVGEGPSMHSVEEVIDLMRNARAHDAPWFWRDRWAEGRTGWHEPGGNAGLRAAWPPLADNVRVLVPLCGKSPDLLWLARRGHDVTGIELSEIAVRDFFEDNAIEYETGKSGSLDRFAAVELPLALYCGDYFAFGESGFDALYDRGALVALPPDLRGRYVEHTRSLLRDGARRMIITLEYDQTVVSHHSEFATPARPLRQQCPTVPL